MINSELLPKTKLLNSLNSTIARLRMVNQQIHPATLETPQEVVKSMGFIQAQDYLGSLWAVGLRMKRASQVLIEQALADGSIVRTWPSRNTLGVVAAEDVRWILELLTPRAMFARKGRYRQLGLDEEAFKSAARLITEALSGHTPLARSECYRVLEAGGVSTEGQRGIHILSHLALEKLICFGPREGKQQTFVLLDEWVPETIQKSREEALADLALRYFSSHGPATVKDFAWWSGLTIGEVKTGLENVKSQLAEEHVNNSAYWMPQHDNMPMGEAKPVLLPGFDEYLVGYTDRSAVLAPELARGVNANGGMLNPIIVIGGLVKGTWKRTLKKGAVEIAANWFETPGADDIGGFEVAAKAYADFLGLEPTLHGSIV